MQKFFIHDGHTQLGPFSAKELTDRNITPCTPVNISGLPGYLAASEIPELQESFKNRKEVLKDKYAASNVKIKPGWFKKKLGWVLAVAAIIFGAFVFYNLEHVVEDVPAAAPVTAQSFKQDLSLSNTSPEKNEQADALQFLTLHGKMHNNLLGKKIIKGTITNKDTTHGYRDLQIAVVFLAANMAELQTQRIFINEAVPYNNSITFRDVLKAPEETVSFRLKILSATPMP